MTPRNSVFSRDESGRWVRIDRKAMLRYGREAAEAPLWRPGIPLTLITKRPVGLLYIFTVMTTVLREIGRPFWPNKFRWNLPQKPIARPVKKRYVLLDGNLPRKRIK